MSFMHGQIHDIYLAFEVPHQTFVLASYYVRIAVAIDGYLTKLKNSYRCN